MDKKNKKNIEECFSNSYLDFNNNKIVEITKNKEQVAIALINIKNPREDSSEILEISNFLKGKLVIFILYVLSKTIEVKIYVKNTFLKL